MAATINGQVGFNKGFSKNSLLGFPKQKVISGISAYGQSGITNWLDASRFDTITLNAGRVAGWVDWVGGANFTQGTAGSQPLYIASHANFNNLPSIQSDSNSRQLIGSTGGQMFLRGNWFLACTLQPSSFNTQLTGVFGTFANSDIPSDLRPDLVWFSSTNNQIQWGASGIVSETSNLNPYIVIITSEGKICLNGVITTFVFNFNNRTAQINRIFRYLGGLLATANARNFLGHLGELIVGSGEMNDADILRWSDNINANYLIY
jgi:hypothetical protein